MMIPIKSNRKIVYIFAIFFLAIISPIALGCGNCQNCGGGCMGCPICQCIYLCTSPTPACCVSTCYDDSQYQCCNGGLCPKSSQCCSGSGCCGSGTTCCGSGNCCNPDLCQECVNGECLECGGREYEECCNGECCNLLECKICFEGNCISYCDPDSCEECVDGACKLCSNRPDEACCDGECYNTTTYGCCDGTIYNKNTQKCCPDTGSGSYVCDINEICCYDGSCAEPCAGMETNPCNVERTSDCIQCFNLPLMCNLNDALIFTGIRTFMCWSGCPGDCSPLPPIHCYTKYKCTTVNGDGMAWCEGEDEYRGCVDYPIGWTCYECGRDPTDEGKEYDYELGKGCL